MIVCRDHTWASPSAQAKNGRCQALLFALSDRASGHPPQQIKIADSQEIRGKALHTLYPLDYHHPNIPCLSEQSTHRHAPQIRDCINSENISNREERPRTRRRAGTTDSLLAQASYARNKTHRKSGECQPPGSPISPAASGAKILSNSSSDSSFVQLDPKEYIARAGGLNADHREQFARANKPCSRLPQKFLKAAIPCRNSAPDCRQPNTSHRPARRR